MNKRDKIKGQRITIHPGLRVMDTSTDNDESGVCIAIDAENVVYRTDAGELRMVAWSLVGVCPVLPPGIERQLRRRRGGPENRVR